MSEYGNIDQALAGLQYGTNARIDSAIAQEIIYPGAPVMGYNGVDGKAYNSHADQSVVTITVALVTGDILNITINGTAFAQTYATSSDATMTALMNAINASAAMIAAGITASLTGTSNFLTITLKTMGLDLTIVTSVTHGGSGTATASHVETCWANFLGVALFAQMGGRDYGAGMSSADGVVPSSGGTMSYRIGMPVNIMNFGRVWVPVNGTVNDKDAAYMIYAAGATQNQFTSAPSGNKSLSSVFASSKNSQGLAVLEVRSIV